MKGVSRGPKVDGDNVEANKVFDYNQEEKESSKDGYRLTLYSLIIYR